MDDKSLGYTIMIITAACMVGYFIWLIPGHFGLLGAVDYSMWAIKIPVILIQIKPIAKHKLVRNFKTTIPDWNIDLSTFNFVQERANVQARRFSSGKHV